jgi:hypothetical protein
VVILNICNSSPCTKNYCFCTHKKSNFFELCNRYFSSLKLYTSLRRSVGALTFTLRFHSSAQAKIATIYAWNTVACTPSDVTPPPHTHTHTPAPDLSATLDPFVYRTSPSDAWVRGQADNQRSRDGISLERVPKAIIRIPRGVTQFMRYRL